MAYSGEKQGAINFANTYCNLLDKHRTRLCLYLADDAVLDWFGRTIRGKESISGFMNLELPQTVHTLTSVEPSGPIQHRSKPSIEHMDEDGNNVISKKETGNYLSNHDLATPLDYSKSTLQTNEDDLLSELSLNNLSFRENNKDKETDCIQSWETQFTTPVNCDISKEFKKVVLEEGQGDCLLKTVVHTFTEANKFLEARGSIEFQRCKQSKVMPKNMKLLSDTMKWSRVCKLQLAYSTSGSGFLNNDCGDGLDNNFKIWLVVYQDNTRCRRNLLDAFDQVN
ncbi:hypothetical protein L9F63_015188 [Diploptera punctata]|uniref:Uncharacterized protein n=1 Tax=Diploptera punctata TaxID=6984 RepID=A0AAD8A6A0_DIPPU|nr:hypothetical protein L9F63_015188 [Diploptera punctata]